MADPLTETIQRLVRESGVPAEQCRVHVDGYPDGWQVCIETSVSGLRCFKSEIVRRGGSRTAPTRNDNNLLVST